MKSDAADGQNGGLRSVQVSSLPTSPCASVALPGYKCQRARPLLHLGGLAYSSVEHHLLRCNKSRLYKPLCATAGGAVQYGIWTRERKLKIYFVLY